jgi:hypothetical protein
MLLLCWSHRYKNYTVVTTNWYIFLYKIKFKSSLLKLWLGWSLIVSDSPEPPIKDGCWFTKHNCLFNSSLLLYYKSKWAQILTVATWHCIVQHIFCFSPANLLNILWKKTHIKIFCKTNWVEVIFGWPTFFIVGCSMIFSIVTTLVLEHRTLQDRNG